jgi:hypothetical protein
MEITKEYFDEQLAKLATKADLDERLAAQTKELKAYADEKQADLAGMIERTINVTSRVDRLEHDIQDIKRALNLA